MVQVITYLLNVYDEKKTNKISLNREVTSTMDGAYRTDSRIFEFESFKERLAIPDSTKT